MSEQQQFYVTDTPDTWVVEKEVQGSRYWQIRTVGGLVIETRKRTRRDAEAVRTSPFWLRYFSERAVRS
jgi:hypothetical protein